MVQTSIYKRKGEEDSEGRRGKGEFVEKEQESSRDFITGISIDLEHIVIIGYHWF